MAFGEHPFNDTVGSNKSNYCCVLNVPHTEYNYYILVMNVGKGHII